MEKVVLLSGGIDSSTCLALARKENNADDVLALNCYYGQKNKKEMESAKKICDFYGVKRIEIDLAQIFSYSDCPMLINSKKDIEQRSYKEQTEDTKGIEPISSYVPFRNGIMLSTAVAVAYSIGAKEVWYGAHADDSRGGAYPDCSESFIEAINKAVIEGTAGKISIKAPLSSMHKKDVIALGTKIGVPYQFTWSCYEAGDKPCGKCGTCIDRINAFKENGLEDPLDY